MSSTVSTVGTTPLHRVIKQIHGALPASLVGLLVANLKQMAAAGENLFGTMSSGSDIFAVVIEELQEFWAAEYHVDVRFRHAFSCELDKHKSAFLLTQICPRSCLFGDNEHMGKTSAQCKRHGVDCTIPHIRIGAAGFSCQSRASCNPSRASNVGRG